MQLKITMTKRSLIVIAVLVGLAVLLIFFAKQLNGYETVTVSRGKIVQAVYATGEVEPRDWSKVSTQIPGKITKIFVKEGQFVKQGEILAQMDDSVERAKLAEYEARQTYLKIEEERYNKLALLDYASKKQYQKVQSDLSSVTAELDAQNKLVQRMQITAPLDGVVLQKNIEEGESVVLGNILFWVGSLDNLIVNTEIDEEDIPYVSVRQKCLITTDSFPDKSFTGEIGEITPRGDPVDKNFKAKITLPQKTPLLVGMTVEVNIVTNENDNAVLVPNGAINNGKVYLKENGKIVAKNVKAGIHGQTMTEIVDGVKEGDIMLLYPDIYLNKQK